MTDKLTIDDLIWARCLQLRDFTADDASIWIDGYKQGLADTIKTQINTPIKETSYADTVTASAHYA